MEVFLLENVEDFSELNAILGARGRRLFTEGGRFSESDRLLGMYYEGFDFEKMDLGFFAPMMRWIQSHVAEIAGIVQAREMYARARKSDLRTQWYHCGRWMLTAENGSLEKSDMLDFLLKGRQKNGSGVCYLG